MPAQAGLPGRPLARAHGLEQALQLLLLGQAARRVAQVQAGLEG